MSGGPAERLRAVLCAEGGLVAEALAAADEAEARPGLDPAATAVRGPRARGREDELGLLLCAIEEGQALHHRGCGRVVAPDGDDDLALLAGDRLYALGLERLAALGDLEAVAELADVIVLGAVAQARGDEDLAAAAWVAGAAAVGWGPDPGLDRAKTAALDGRADALRAAAAERMGAGTDGPMGHLPPSAR